MGEEDAFASGVLASGCYALNPGPETIYHGVQFTTHDNKILIELRADANFYINGKMVEDPIEIVETMKSWMRDYTNSR